MKNSPTFFTVGPTQLYPQVDSWMTEAFEQHIPSMSHRGNAFHELYESVEHNLKTLLTIPQDYSIFFLSSGTEAWERIIENGVEKSASFFVNGIFSERFYKTALSLGKTAYAHTAPHGEICDVYSTPIHPNTELIGLTHSDTSTGIWFPAEDIEYLRKTNPNTLIAVDSVSSAPYIPFNISRVDSLFFSVQKGFGLPAGLGVWVVSPRMIEKAEYLEKKGISVGSYHSIPSLVKYRAKWETPETPNVLTIYLLDRVVRAMNETGVATIQKETEEKWDLLNNFFDDHATLKPFVEKPEHRSHTVMVVKTQGKTAEIKNKLQKQGIVVGSGYGDYANDHIRIANFPAHGVEDILKLISIL